MAACRTTLGRRPNGEVVRMVDIPLKMAPGKRLALTTGWCFWVLRRMAQIAWDVNKEDFAGGLVESRNVGCWLGIAK